MQDDQIIALYFARSETAITETDHKYGAYLNQVAYRILRDASDTEEIVNDTYLGAWNAIPPTRPKELRHFLARITRNLSFNRLDYRTAIRRQGYLQELEECIPDAKNQPDQLWEAREIGVQINVFLETLDRKVCALFVARYFYGYSYRELTENYGMPERKIKYLLSKTRKALHNHLQKEGILL